MSSNLAASIAQHFFEPREGHKPFRRIGLFPNTGQSRFSSLMAITGTSDVWVTNLNHSIAYRINSNGKTVDRMDTGLISPICLGFEKESLWFGDHESSLIKPCGVAPPRSLDLKTILVGSGINNPEACRAQRAQTIQGNLVLNIFRPNWNRFLLELRGTAPQVHALHHPTLSRFSLFRVWRDKYVVFNYRPGAVMLYDPDKKKLQPLGGAFFPDNINDVAVDGDSLYVLTPGVIHQYNLATGKLLFRFHDSKLPHGKSGARVDVLPDDQSTTLVVAGADKVVFYSINTAG